jgi:hydroxypyruvate isomerase
VDPGRRGFVQLMGAVGGTLVAGRGAWWSSAAAAERPSALQQSVARWPYEDIPLDDFCLGVRQLGLGAIDLLHQDEWAVAAQHGLKCSMGYCSRRSGLIQRGWNDPANHDLLIAEVTAALPAAAAAGVPNLIVMSGNRRGQAVGQGIAQCAAGLRQVAPLAERHGVTLCLEMLNSRVDHADYDADGTRYGLEVVQRVGSPRVRLLYDVYHMQIMEGDVIHTIREHRAAFAHFHTAGVPGRHELDERQELNYRAIATAIAETGFAGFLAHEFIPTRPPYDGLREAMRACAV